MASGPARVAVQALPEGLIRHLGSTQSITDASSVVKELLDNALDAHATTINIEIAANTLDSIQLRDNGHGIAAEDRLMVARRHCTSKLRVLEELKTVAATSLGFRGEALASMAAMSGGMTVLTRVPGEDTAIRLEIAKNGEVVKPVIHRPNSEQSTNMCPGKSALLMRLVQLYALQISSRPYQFESRMR